MAQNVTISSTENLVWRTLQVVLFIVGLGMMVLMVNDSLRFIPALNERFGRDVFWNVLVTAAPLLLALAPGLWRNICPLGTASQFPKYLGLSKNKMQTQKQQGYFYLVAIVLLLVLVPIRHIETSGLTVVIALGAVGIVALILGVMYKDKSGFCNGICPVLPVEKLYGTKPLFTFSNSHCAACSNCVSPCPDSKIAGHPASNQGSKVNQIAAYIFIGGFPGFVWGWFQISDYPTAIAGWNNVANVYGLPIAGLVATLIVYWLLRNILGEKQHTRIISVFAAAAISCYYWYRIPAILGFADTPGFFGVDLSASLPNLPLIARVITILFFGWWFVLRNNVKFSWEVRPPFTSTVQSQTL